MMAFMPLVRALTGQSCCEVIGHPDLKECSDCMVSCCSMVNLDLSIVCQSLSASFEVMYQSLVRCRYRVYRFLF